MDPKSIPATPPKKTPTDVLNERREQAKAVVVPVKPVPKVAPAPVVVTSQSLAVDKEASENVLLEVGLFIKKNNFSNKSLKFAAAYLCAKAPKIFGYDLAGKDLEARVEVQLAELVEKYDHLLPIFAGWIDMFWADAIQRQAERYAVRTGYEWMKGFERKYSRLPENLEQDFKLLAS